MALHKGKNQLKLLTADNCGRKILFLVELLIAIMVLASMIIKVYEYKLFKIVNLECLVHYQMDYYKVYEEQIHYQAKSIGYSCNIKGYAILLITLLLAQELLVAVLLISMVIKWYAYQKYESVNSDYTQIDFRCIRVC